MSVAAKKIDYENLEKQRTSQLESQLQEKMESRQSGKIDSLKNTILRYVVEGNFDLARSELDRYVGMQAEYPAFKKRAGRFIDHCHDVIQAIKTKKSFPGLHTLPVAKQQEIFEKVLEHFEELKHFLHKIELTVRDVKMEDLRSTVWVIKAMAYCTFLVVTIFFLRSAAMSILQSFDYVINDYTNSALDWVFGLFD